MNNKIHKLVKVALYTAIMFILTAFIAIPIGSFGYINLSDFLIMLLSGVLDPFSLILVAGIGTSLADLFMGFAYYAFFTFIIKALEAFLIFKLLKRHFKTYLAFGFGVLLMLVGYGLSDVILTLDPFIFFTSFMMNLPQGLCCVLLALILFKRFEKLEMRFN